MPQHVDFDDRYASVHIDDTTAPQVVFVSVAILVCALFRSALDLLDRALRSCGATVSHHQ